ncbi:hypothetical protein B0H13DRAFT_1922358 [Mycena leptocephala]|nr:hypothetical protein B0H13DRAFT_1922358 [Mycena leptocephala]
MLRNTHPYAHVYVRTPTHHRTSSHLCIPHLLDNHSIRIPSRRPATPSLTSPLHNQAELQVGIKTVWANVTGALYADVHVVHSGISDVAAFYQTALIPEDGGRPDNTMTRMLVGRRNARSARDGCHFSVDGLNADLIHSFDTYRDTAKLPPAGGAAGACLGGPTYGMHICHFKAMDFNEIERIFALPRLFLDTAALPLAAGAADARLCLWPHVQKAYTENELRRTFDRTHIGNGCILFCRNGLNLQRSKILIPDKDYKTDAVIQESLRIEVNNDTTLLIIAHRLQIIMDADKIVEFGTPKDLFAKENGKLRSLIQESADRDVLIEMANKGAGKTRAGI